MVDGFDKIEGIAPTDGLGLPKTELFDCSLPAKDI